MSAYFPPTQTARLPRPGTATAGAIIAIVMSSLSLLLFAIAAIVILSNHVVMSALNFVGARDTVVIFLLIAVGLCVLGVVAGIQTLRDSNGWRITTVVFGFLVGAMMIVSAIGNFSEDRSCINDSYYNSCANSGSNTGGGVFALIWAALAIASAVLLLVNGANAHFSGQNQPGWAYQPPASPAVYSSPTAPPAVPAAAAPAGWYPVEGGKLRWWDGQTWTDHFNDPV